MQADDPPFLPVGTDVSAKYKGAFCEAKIKKVVRNIKCKVSLKGTGLGSITVTDEAIKGPLRVGNTVEVKLDQKKEMTEGIITKIQDCSQYTVVFDDGDITTLRRSALCLKSGRHFAESETLDQLPLTHPEHFGNPVIGSSGRRGRRTNRAHEILLYRIKENLKVLESLGRLRPFAHGAAQKKLVTGSKHRPVMGHCRLVTNQSVTFDYKDSDSWRSGLRFVSSVSD